MAPKPEPATSTPPITRSQTQREAAAESVAPLPTEGGGSELSDSEMLRKLLLRQDNLIDRQDTLIEQVAALQDSRSTVSQQIEDLTSRMSRVESSSSGETPPTNIPSSTGRPSDDARVAQSDPSVTTPSRDAPAVDPIPASFQDLVSKMAPGDQSQMRALMGKYGPDNSVSKLDGRAAPTSTAIGPPNANTPASPAFAGNKSLVCKKEVLGEFDGDPSKLEHFLGRVQAIANSNSDPAWEIAIVCTLPQCFVGDAQIWHIGLNKAETSKLTTVEAWCKTMRRRFPVNTIEQRKQAHARKWEPATETSMTYYFKKAQLFRSAYGDVLPDEALGQEVMAALPASMRALIRLPQTAVTLEEVQDALCEWEPTWREDRSIPLIKTKVKSKSGSASASTPTSQPLAALTPLPSCPPRSDQRPMLTAIKPTVQVSDATSTPAMIASLSATYDPARVIPATNGQPRMYRRPDSTKVMRLARNCGKCGGQHFDFEHDHVLKAGQLNAIDSLTEDYPEVDEAELDLQHF
ncbi:hypothetical protein CF326_g4062 [Tilletia indica]|nr:hypothetical protein CF326_g4062 [Tilletia indica]